MKRRVLYRLIHRPLFSLMVIGIFFVLGSIILLSMSVNSAGESELEQTRVRQSLNVSLQVNIENAYQRKKVPIITDPQKPIDSHDNKVTDQVETSTSNNVPVLTLENAQKLSFFKEVRNVKYLAMVPVVGENIKPVGEDPKNTLTIEQQPQFQLEGVSEFALFTLFHNQDNSLVSGNLFTEMESEKMVAIINQELASKNNLRIGDKFQIKSVNAKKVEEYEVIAISKSNLKRSTGVAGRVPYLFPENKIYVPVKTISHFQLSDNGEHIIDRAEYSLTAETDFDSFRLKAIQKGIDLSNYQFYQNDSNYQTKATPLLKITRNSLWLALGAIFSIFLFSILFAWISCTKRQLEIKSLLLMGVSNRSIFVQLTIEMALLTTLGLMLSVIASPILIGKLPEIFRYFGELSNSSNNNGLRYLIDVPNPNDALYLLTKLPYNISIPTSFGMLAVGFAVSANGVMYPLWKIWRISQQRLLIDNE